MLVDPEVRNNGWSSRTRSGCSSVCLFVLQVYVPRDENNEVDYDDYNYNDVEFGLRSEVAVESVVIIVLASLLVTVLFFASLFLYYTIGKVS